MKRFDSSRRAVVILCEASPATATMCRARVACMSAGAMDLRREVDIHSIFMRVAPERAGSKAMSSATLREASVIAVASYYDILRDVTSMFKNFINIEDARQRYSTTTRTSSTPS